MTAFAIALGPDYPPFTGTEPCTKEDPELFHPTSATTGPDMERAKAVCRPCPMREECLDWALRRGESGVWGGTSDKGRQEIRKRTGLRSVAPGSPIAVRAEIFRLLDRGLPDEVIASHIDRPVSHVRSVHTDYRRVGGAQRTA